MDNPRLSIPITERQQRLLQQHLPWGAKATIFRLIIDDLLEMFYKHGSQKVLGAFLSRAATLEDIIKTEIGE
jgi:hypothetical protein